MDIDDTLPMSANVEREFVERAEETMAEALAWLDERDFESKAIANYVGKLAMMQGKIAVPIYKDGAFVDLLLVSDGPAYEAETVTGRAKWLGTIDCRQTVRLHARPIDWLDAGCVGVCHIAPFSRDTLRQLRKARTIECDDIGVAFEAWEFGFDANERKLPRFLINVAPSMLREYLEAEAYSQISWRRSRGAY